MEHEPINSISSLEYLQESSDIVNAFDEDHRILFWNKGCENLFKIKKEQALGRVLEELLPYVKRIPEAMFFTGHSKDKKFMY